MASTPSPVAKIAAAYLKAGYSVIPIPAGNEKRPKIRWKPYQTTKAKPAELEAWFGNGNGQGASGIAIICGAVSGALEVIDFDDAQAYDQWADLLEGVQPGLLARFARVRTPGGGVHVYTRLECKAQGNQKLALAEDGQTLIETRGEGGYVLAPGSPAECHPDKKLYTLMPGPSIENTGFLAVDDRETMHSLAKALNRKAEPAFVETAQASSNRPGDQFNREANWEQLLGDAGWTKILERGQVSFWRRPGKKEDSWSATLGACRGKTGQPLFFVFSTGASPFRVGKTYDPFGFFAELHHGGDTKAAARALGAQGYGEQRQSQHASTNGNGNGKAHPQKPPEPEAWQPPIPLSELPAPEKFPLKVLPERVRQFVEEVSWAVGTPPDFAAVPVLAVAGSAIGNTRRLKIKQGHYESACLYTCIIGKPGQAKTPVLDMVKEPLEKAERAYRADYDRKKKRWEEDGEPDTEPRPMLRRQLVDNSTMEATLGIMAENPRGFLIHQDELVALITGLNQYKGGKGNDRQHLLKINSGGSIRTDRRGNKDLVPIYVPRSFACITGGIQPAVLASLRSEPGEGHDSQESTDGFIERFLPAYPDPLPATKELWREVGKKVSEDWDQTVQRLLRLQNQEEDRAWLLPLDKSGQKAWEAFTEAHAAEDNRGMPTSLGGSWAKLRSFCPRLALIIHLLRMVSGELDGIDFDDMRIEGNEHHEVGGEDLEAGWELTKYFWSHIQRVAFGMELDPKIGNAFAVLKWIKKNQAKAFNAADLYRSIRNTSNFTSPDSLAAPLAILEKHGHIRQAAQPDRAGGGRPHSKNYEVNPFVFQEAKS